MLNTASSTVLLKGVKNLQVAETSLLLLVSVLLQFLIHLVPPVNGSPLGQILLPAFYAPLFALIFFRMHVALTTAILTPMLNYLITGMPRPEMLPVLTIELVAFVLIAYFIMRNEKNQVIAGVTAVILAKILSAAVMPFLFSSYSGSLIQSLIMSVPGILIIAVLNIVLLRYKSN